MLRKNILGEIGKLGNLKQLNVLLKKGMEAPYYLARVQITEEGNNLLGKRKMRPGMEVGVVIKTGSRTLMTYLLHPLTRRVAFSLKEE